MTRDPYLAQGLDVLDRFIPKIRRNVWILASSDLIPALREKYPSIFVTVWNDDEANRGRVYIFKNYKLSRALEIRNDFKELFHQGNFDTSGRRPYAAKLRYNDDIIPDHVAWYVWDQKTRTIEVWGAAPGFDIFSLLGDS